MKTGNYNTFFSQPFNFLFSPIRTWKYLVELSRYNLIFHSKCNRLLWFESKTSTAFHINSKFLMNRFELKCSNFIHNVVTNTFIYLGAWKEVNHAISSSYFFVYCHLINSRHPTMSEEKQNLKIFFTVWNDEMSYEFTVHNATFIILMKIIFRAFISNRIHSNSLHTRAAICISGLGNINFC